MRYSKNRNKPRKRKRTQCKINYLISVYKIVCKKLRFRYKNSLIHALLVSSWKLICQKADISASYSFLLLYVYPDNYCISGLLLHLLTVSIQKTEYVNLISRCVERASITSYTCPPFSIRPLVRSTFVLEFYTRWNTA